jgi:thioredoxin reductase/SAM-dependent methyltransferase
MTARTERRYDVVIIGGGAAGLSGALTLARARRSVLIIDAGRPRNATAAHVHTYLGREGTPPRDLLAGGRAEAAAYGAEFRDAEVTGVERLDDAGFRLVLGDAGAVVADRLLVATGLRDELPDVDGIEERWGRDVPHCPYCHGWEVRDQAIGVLATGPLAVHQALLWRQWSPTVTFFRHTGPAPTPDEEERLAARGIAVVDGRATGLTVEDDRLTGVRLEDGTTVPCDALAVMPRLVARAEVLAGLGVRTEEHRIDGYGAGTYVPADPTGATEAPGVWVAGNVTGLSEQVIGSAAAGVRAGAAINTDLIEEETRRAVTALRERRTREGVDFWDNRYGESDRIWSGDPNVVLVREVETMTPGTALDLGCGEGADAIWLARRGWRVTAADISRVALERAARQAATEGVDGVDWQWHDLGSSFPEGEFDLVSAQFLHSPGDMPRERILRTAAGAVAPGGVLLVVGHAEHPLGRHPEVHLPNAREVLAGLGLPGDAWEVETCEDYERPWTSPDGEAVVLKDSVVRARRRRRTQPVTGRSVGTGVGAGA